MGCLIFSYIAIRSVLLDITYDEAWTLKDFVSLSISNIFTYSPCDANNHLLNTILIKFFYFILPNTIFVARIPNVLASILFILFSYKICQKFFSEKIAVLSFILLLVNPFLLDFYCQARGYGLGLAFQMGSIYYFLSYIQDSNSKNVFFLLFFSFLSVLSVFVMINFFIAEICIIILISFLRSSLYSIKSNILYSASFSLCLALIIYIPIIKLIESHSLYYGGRTSFYFDTLGSLMQFSLYLPSIKAEVYTILNYFLFTFIVIISLSFLHKQKLISVKNGILLILFLCIIAVIFQFYLFGTLYVLDRAALYFYPLFILAFSFSLNDIKIIKFKNILLFIICLTFCINFVKNVNFNKTALNFFEAHTEHIFYLINENGKKENKIMKLDFSWPFQSSFRYYIDTKKYPNIELIKNPYDRADVNLDFDYYVFLNKHLERACYWSQSENILKYQNDLVPFMTFPDEGIIIFKKIK